MLLKNLVTVSLGVVLSLKAMIKDEEVYRPDLTTIENRKKTLADEQSNYRIRSDYPASDYFAFDAATIDPTAQKTAIFGSKTALCKLQNLNLPTSDTYVFSAALELTPEPSTPEKTV
ncbi:hypothetical protein CXQ81_02100 [Pseudomonas sp. 09C 129]|uniref:hypothetical protein n=1 Tax=Pseudomonas sp. 09C 129 TaxID=2054915 RepID=UPI000C6DD91C|nr:hypothetical protein [Pseudomonas sp. 09C 129]AUF99431.1 hypothetical protein CXQ81_02100 [Pseudomonas sp. 09C 129]